MRTMTYSESRAKYAETPVTADVGRLENPPRHSDSPESQRWQRVTAHAVIRAGGASFRPPIAHRGAGITAAH